MEKTIEKPLCKNCECKETCEDYQYDMSQNTSKKHPSPFYFEGFRPADKDNNREKNKCDGCNYYKAWKTIGGKPVMVVRTYPGKVHGFKGTCCECRNFLPMHMYL